jgi:hypothetical protein
VSVAVPFLRRLVAVPEPSMRQAIWREAFALEGPEVLLALVDAVLAAMEDRADGGELAYLSLIDHLDLTRGQPDEGRRALYEAAHAAGNEGVMRLLLSRPAARSLGRDEASSPPLRFDREVTLGERRTLARSHDRNVLNRLLYDADPGVVINLLANSRLVEYDVLKMASRRPNTVEVLSLLFRHPKWGRRRDVRRALVFNPYTPGDIALALVPVLDPADLRALSVDGLVHPSVRDRARELLGRPPLEPEPQADEAPDERFELPED